MELCFFEYLFCVSPGFFLLFTGSVSCKVGCFRNETREELVSCFLRPWKTEWNVFFSVVCFASRDGLERAIEKFQRKDVNGRKLKLFDDSDPAARDSRR